MLLIKGKLVVAPKEDDGKIIAKKATSEYGDLALQESQYELVSEDGGYVFKCTQSPFKNPNDIGTYATPHVFLTKGNAIRNMNTRKFQIFINDQKMTK